MNNHYSKLKAKKQNSEMYQYTGAENKRAKGYSYDATHADPLDDYEAPQPILSPQKIGQAYNHLKTTLQGRNSDELIGQS